MNRDFLEQVILGLDTGKLLEALSAVGVNIDPSALESPVLSGMAVEPESEYWNDRKTAPVASPRPPIFDRAAWENPDLNDVIEPKHAGEYQIPSGAW